MCEYILDIPLLRKQILVAEENKVEIIECAVNSNRKVRYIDISTARRIMDRYDEMPTKRLSNEPK